MENDRKLSQSIYFESQITYRDLDIAIPKFMEMSMEHYADE